MNRIRNVMLPTFGILALVLTSALAVQKFVVYRSAALGFQIKVPAEWVTKETGKAVAFRDSEGPNWRGAIGILKSSVQGLTIDQAAEQQMKKEGAADWVKTPANLATRRAIKIVGSAAQSDAVKMVEYYVETDDGYFLIQCLAPKNQWNQFSPTFSTMLRTFELLF